MTLLLWFWMFFFFLTFVGTFLVMRGYAISYLIYILAIFQICFVLYRFRFRYEIDAASFLSSFLVIIFLILLFQFFRTLFPKKQETEFSRFVLVFIDLAFSRSYIIIHQILLKFTKYEEFICLFVCNTVFNSIRKYPFPIIFISIVLPSIVLNIFLFLEIVFNSTVYLILYIFIFNFFFTMFFRLTFFLTRYFYSKVLLQEENFFINIPINIDFLLAVSFKEEYFISFPENLRDLIYSRYLQHKDTSFYVQSITFFEIWIRTLRSFFFYILICNLIVCFIWSRLSWYGSDSLFFLLGIPFIFYFFSLLLSTFMENFSFFLDIFFKPPFLNSQKVLVLSWIVLFLYLCFFIGIYGISFSIFILLWGGLLFCFYFMKNFFLSNVLSFFYFIHRFFCYYGGVRYQAFAYYLGVTLMDNMLSRKYSLEFIPLYFCKIPFRILFFFLLLELGFFFQLRYMAIVLFLCSFLYFISFFLFYVMNSFTRENLKMHINWLSENCEYTTDSLENCRILPEDFIDHSLVVEDVWYRYLELRYFQENLLFISNVLYLGLCAYGWFAYKCSVFVLFIYFVTFLFSYFSLFPLLLSFYLVLLAYFSFIYEKLYHSPSLENYVSQIILFLQFSEEETVWFNLQKVRAKEVFASIIKTRQEEENKQESSL
jgi:hypothetical protein